MVIATGAEGRDTSPDTSVGRDRPYGHARDRRHAFPPRMVGIEPSGAKWHSTATQVRRDEERKTLLRRLGWDITDLTLDMVVHHPEQAIAAIRAALCRSAAA